MPDPTDKKDDKPQGGGMSDGLTPQQKKKIHITDPRTVTAFGEPIQKGRTGDYDEDVIKNIALAAMRMGNDPKTALAIAFQESGMGTYTQNNAQNNWGQVLDVAGKPDPKILEQMRNNPDLNSYAVAMNHVLKQKMSMTKDGDDEAMRIQAYNGYGKVGANNDIGAKKLYGVDLTKNTIDMSKTPLYGKSVLDIRENIINKNPDLLNYINSLQQPQGMAGGLAPQQGQPNTQTWTMPQAATYVEQKR